MEQSGRAYGFALILLSLLAAAAGAWVLLSRRAGPAPSTSRTPVALAGNEHIIVEVLNGSRQRGLARTATRELRKAGFDVVFFGTTNEARSRTEVLSRRGDSSSAALVARALGSGAVRVARDTLLRVDVTVLLGDDYRPAPGIHP